MKRVGGEPLIVKNMSFAYDGKEIFNNLNLEINAGDFCSIIGPSGCGKTTLLNLLAGFLQPNTGHIRMHDRDIIPEDPLLGYVFQTSALFPWLTALENAEFGLKMVGVGQKERQKTAQSYLDLVGLSEFGDYLPHRLSGGMQQRVSLARTLVNNPHLLLMDEPFGALDALTREVMQDELLRIWHDLGQTVIFITHDIDEAVYLSDRIIVLNVAPNGIFTEINSVLPRPRSGPKTRTDNMFWEYKKSLIQHITDVHH